MRAREGKCARGEKIAARAGERAVWRLQRKERGKEKRVEVHLESGGGGGVYLLHPVACPARFRSQLPLHPRLLLHP